MIRFPFFYDLLSILLALQMEQIPKVKYKHYQGVFVWRPLLFSSKEGKTRASSSICKNDQADFTDWIPFLSFNLVEETSHELEALRASSAFDALKMIPMQIN